MYYSSPLLSSSEIYISLLIEIYQSLLFELFSLDYEIVDAITLNGSYHMVFLLKNSGKQAFRIAYLSSKSF